MLAFPRCDGDGCQPPPDFGPGEDLLATIPVAVPQEGYGTARDEPGEIPVTTRHEQVKDSHICLATRRGPEFDFFGHPTGENCVKFGVKTFFFVEEEPWVVTVGRYPFGHTRAGISQLPQAVAAHGPQPCRSRNSRDHPPNAASTKTN